jgi:hypothetical protein
MHHDKDRSGKWLLDKHGDALLRLAGITGFVKWEHAPAEVVAPRRSLDGLFKLTYPGEREPRLVIVEIESYADSTADHQVMDGIMLVTLEHRRVPDVVSLILKPKGNVAVHGRDERASHTGQVRLVGTWPVVRLWEIDAETLFADGDDGLIPLAPLARTDLPPVEIVTRCVDRMNAVADDTERSSLLTVASVFLKLAGAPFDLIQLPGGKAMFLEKIVRQMEEAELAEAREKWKGIYVAEGQRASVIAVLEARFGSVPQELAAAVTALDDERLLRHLARTAGTCPDLAAFAAELSADFEPGT